MAANTTTGAASSITSSGARLNGSWVSDGTCCIAPCCPHAQRFYYGTTNPPGTLTSAGSFCSDVPNDCNVGQSYNKTVGGLTKDTTHYVQANVVISGCGGGCSGSDNGSILSFKTCGGTITFGTPANDTPGQTSVSVSILVNPAVVETNATIKVQYKLDTEPTIWTDGSSKVIRRDSSATETFLISGLSAGTAYDFRFVVTRGVSCGASSGTSAEGSFTTAASSQSQSNAETVAPTDLFTMEITGQAVEQADTLAIVETVSILIQSTGEETMTGVWFFHLPTRSYWFWNFDNFSAAINDTDADDKARLFVALGSELYIGDDEEYFEDDRDQNRPLDDQVGSEMELSLVPRTMDAGGQKVRAAGLDIKWGGSPTLPDVLGSADVDLVADTYPRNPVPPDSRKVLATRRVPIGPATDGADEYRRYALPRVRPTDVIGLRITFPRGLVPHRRQPISIEKIRINAVTAPYIKRKRV